MHSKCRSTAAAMWLAVFWHRGRNLALVLWLAALGIMQSADATGDEHWDSLQLLGREIAPGERSKFPFIPDRSFEASYLNTPVFVARGLTSGATVCLTAGVHGDELNGVEIARRVFAQIDPQKMRGTLIALPAINAEGVRTGSRYLSDRRDLNRAFPGRAGGSVASLIAHSVFTLIQDHCDALVDLHTASNQRTNLPQIRADLLNPAIRGLAIHFGTGIVVSGSGPEGSLRRESAQAGIPAIIYEAGGPHRFEVEEIERGVRGIENVMAYLDMTEQADREIPAERIYERSTWVRAAFKNGGFFFPTAELGDFVRAGDSLGEIVDPFTDESFDIIAPASGEIIGMAVPQPVLSGYALFHLAWHDTN